MHNKKTEHNHHKDDHSINEQTVFDFERLNFFSLGCIILNLLSVKVSIDNVSYENHYQYCFF